MNAAGEKTSAGRVGTPEFVRIHRENRPAVLSYLRTRVRPSEAEDLTQEVFRKAEHGLAAFRGEASVRTWLLRIATRTALDHVRSRRGREEQRTDPLPEPEQPCQRTPDALVVPADAPIRVVSQEMHACIREYVDRLPTTYREVIRLKELDGLSNEEVARHLGIAPGAAKIRLHRAREALRLLLRDGCELYSMESHGLGCDRLAPRQEQLSGGCAGEPTSRKRR